MINSLGINSVLAGGSQYANRTQQTSINKTGFMKQLQKPGAAADALKVDGYMEYLRSKYGNVKIQSVGKDQQSLDRAGKSMNGSDVVIAPNILEQMANDPEKAAYYEGKIDDFFEASPRFGASFAAKGLDYQPCGVVVHEDGNVTYISGCSDSPERVAEVNAINKAKREKKAALREASLERSQKAAEKNAMEKSGSSAWAGDMVVPYPPDYSRFTYDSSISNKSKEEMTMDEYKQWVMNEMSQMPVSGWVRSTFSYGETVIKEEAFERMKVDPEYEAYVLNRVRSAYSVNGLLVGSGNVSYDVIGASPEECYGYAGPVGNSGFNISGNAKSWWEKRHERMEELMAEQEKEAMKKAWARRAEVQKNHLKSQMVAFAYEENIWTE